MTLTRAQILSFRLRTNMLDRRVALSEQSLQHAAWAGLQDSSPRAALLSLHARLQGVKPETSLVQLWGPRYNDYAVAATDLAIFSLGRKPQDSRGIHRAERTAAQLRDFLQGRRMPFGEAGKAMGVPHNSLRYAATTGTVLLHWDGSRQPVIWTVPEPEMNPHEARSELARRFLHVFGPATEAAFVKWAGVSAKSALGSIRKELVQVRQGHWILASDESALRRPAERVTGVRLLPSGDAFYLVWGDERNLLVPDAARRSELWTSRVWPGAVLLNGDIAGIWNRSAGRITIRLWHPVTKADRTAIETEAAQLPLAGFRSVTIDVCR